MKQRCLAMLGVMLTAACSDDTTGADNAQGDAAVAPEAAVCTVPDRPYGMTVGATWPQTTLTDCTTEEPYALYDKADFCAAEVTVISLAAGW